MSANAKVWLEAARPKTLPAALVPVLVGAALAARAGDFALVPAALCLGFALLVQIGTNFANDYGDFVKGADRADRLGPRRVVAAGMVSPRAMIAATALVLAAAFGLGLGLVAWRGWELLPVGIASLLFAWAYTSGPFPLAYRGLGDVFVFIFFGLVAVGGTAYTMTGRIDATTFLAAAPVGLLATNILVVNNHRDAGTDARAGKRTTVVRFGRRFAVRQYAWSLVLAALAPLALAAIWRRPLVALPALVLGLGIFPARDLGSGLDAAGLNALLARTARVLLAFGAAWAAAIAFG